MDIYTEPNAVAPLAAFGPESQERSESHRHGRDATLQSTAKIRSVAPDFDDFADSAYGWEKLNPSSPTNLPA
jgi:hypothetical protein